MVKHVAPGRVGVAERAAILFTAHKNGSSGKNDRIEDDVWYLFDNAIARWRNGFLEICNGNYTSPGKYNRRSGRHAVDRAVSMCTGRRFWQLHTLLHGRGLDVQVHCAHGLAFLNDRVWPEPSVWTVPLPPDARVPPPTVTDGWHAVTHVKWVALAEGLGVPVSWNEEFVGNTWRRLGYVPLWAYLAMRAKLPRGMRERALRVLAERGDLRDALLVAFGLTGGLGEHQYGRSASRGDPQRPRYPGFAGAEMLLPSLAAEYKKQPRKKT